MNKMLACRSVLFPLLLRRSHMRATPPRPSRARRFGAFVLFRFVPLLLIIAILFVGYRVVQSALRYANEASTYNARAADYEAMATAMRSAASPEATAEARQPLVLARRQPELEQVFSTNTPQPQTDLSIAPTPTSALPVVDVTAPPSPTFWIYDTSGDNATAPTAIPTAVQQLDRQGYDLTNIVLLGNDGELTEDGFIRTDTLIIVSINRTTGTVSMLSIPRDLYVYIPGWTMQRINLAYIHGESIGWSDGGFGLLRQTLFYNFGINVHYYAMVDLTGFKAMVDSVGGVNVAVDCAIQDYPLIEAELPAAAYQVSEDGEYVLPVGYYFMNGAEALWYARSRSSSSDFDRGPRQQQVLRAIWRAARENGLLEQVPQLWNEASPYIETNMTYADVLSLVPLAASLDPSRIESFSFQRIYQTTPWQPPSGDFVQLPIYDTIRPMLEDFYTPPTENQVAIEGASVAVYNGTGNANWDRVAAERLAQEGLNAVPMGNAPTTDYANSMVIDRTGNMRGGSLPAIAGALNIAAEDQRIEPLTTREYDYEVYIGSNYTSCTRSGVLDVDG